MLASWAFQDLADLNDLSRVCMMPSGVPAKMLSVPGDTQLTLPCCFHQQTSSRKRHLDLYEHQGPPSRRHQAAGLAKHRKSGKLSTVKVRFCCTAKASLSYRCQSHNFTKPSPVWCYVLVLRDGLASSAVCVGGWSASVAGGSVRRVPAVFVA
jgi:hypothetical protein